MKTMKYEFEQLPVPIEPEKKEIFIHTQNNSYIITQDETHLRIIIHSDEYDKLFELSSHYSKEEVEDFIKLYIHTWDRAFNQGKKYGKNETIKQIREVVSFFAGGLLKETESEG